MAPVPEDDAAERPAEGSVAQPAQGAVAETAEGVAGANAAPTEEPAEDPTEDPTDDVGGGTTSSPGGSLRLPLSPVGADRIRWVAVATTLVSSVALLVATATGYAATLGVTLVLALAVSWGWPLLA